MTPLRVKLPPPELTISGDLASMVTSFARTVVTDESYASRCWPVNIRWTCMTDEKRPYRKKRRAELEERTRQRITESLVELHGTLGPARTSVSALAKHAGVRRATIYRHFPDEEALFAACSSHWRAANPYPDPASWVAVQDVNERLRRALKELYAHYRRNESMIGNLLRDEAVVPILADLLTAYRGYLSRGQEILMGGRTVGDPNRHRVRAAIGHVLAFYTWRSLAIEQGLNDAEAADLMCRLVAVAGGERGN
jgi:AcrR family transcriptional regulator